MASVFSDGVDEVADGEGCAAHVPRTQRSVVRRELQDISPAPPPPYTDYTSPPPPPYTDYTSPPPPPYTDYTSPPPPPYTDYTSPPPPFDAGSAQSTVESSGGKAGLYVGASVGGVVLICLVLSVVWCLRRKRTKVPTTSSRALENRVPIDEQVFESCTGPRRFTYTELANATKNFSVESKLGEGGFGSVYRGHLKDTDVHVAVKRVSKGSKQGKKEYVAEVRVISQLRHRNLVQLVGWCHDDNELLLVYELMPNGSLDTHIHNQEEVLPWSLRHEIVLGVGSALLYLHEEWGQCVLHRDIKPSNLMLDASFKVKLGDFGLARLVDHGQGSHTTTLMGTMGYMDPESMVTGKASKESDIYSFGVVVLEIITGRLPLLVMQANKAVTMQLVQLVWELYGEGRILDAADGRLNGEFDRQQMERMMVAALWCVHPDSSQRPSITDAVNVMRYRAPLPNLPAKMPVVTFALPIDSFLSQSLDTTGTNSSGYGTGTSRYSGAGITGSSSGGDTSSLLR